jgi:hypothetical protein
MSNEYTANSHLIRDGASQSGRMLVALHPHYFKADERSIGELLCLVQKYADSFLYYNTENIPDGSWKSFFTKDLTALISMISLTDCTPSKTEFNNAYTSLVSTTQLNEQKEILQSLFVQLFTLCAEINTWFDILPEGLRIKRELDRIISAQMRNVFLNSIKLLKQAVTRDSLINITEKIYTEVSFNPIWHSRQETASFNIANYITIVPFFSDDTEMSEVQKTDLYAKRLLQWFDTVFNARKQFQTIVPEYISDSLLRYEKHEPHMALTLSFLKLLQFAQVSLNGLTKRHLDYYYRDILQLQKRPAAPNKAHVLFSLAKKHENQALNKNTLLSAGKDRTGKPILYQLTDNVVVTRAVTGDKGDFKALYIDKEKSYQIFSAPVANSADGKGASFTSGLVRWKAFGSASTETMEVAQIGIAISSPHLALSEGKRKVTLTVQCPGTSAATLQELTRENIFLLARLTGKKKWLDFTKIKVFVEASSILEVTAAVISLNIDIQDDFEPVVAYNKEKHNGNYETSFPVLEIIFSNTAYALLKDVLISSITLSLQVENCRQILIQNDNGVQDPSKPFMPFGAKPVVGSTVYIGYDEAFRKIPDTVTLNWEWLDPPNIPVYYKGYPDITSDSVFKAQWNVLYNNSWQNKISQSDLIQLFSQKNEKECAIKANLDKTVSNENILNSNSEKKYSVESSWGFLRLELVSPAIAFGHKEYPKLYAQKTQELALELIKSNAQIVQNEKSIEAKKQEKEKSGESMDISLAEERKRQTVEKSILPNEPYTPVMKSMHLGYTTSVSIDLNKNDSVHVLYQKFPFGMKKVIETTAGAGVYLAPQFTRGDDNERVVHQGELFIGISQLNPPETVSLLFKVDEGSANPEKNAITIEWFYLNDYSWVKLDARKNILKDTTNGLLTTGIIVFDIPPDASRTNPLMPLNKHWIMAAVSRDADAVCELQAIHAQAAEAEFVNNDNDPSLFAAALPAGTIGKLKEKLTAIQSIKQPYATFSGRVEENDRMFYCRQSERLRHKGRAITSWDYERLVLEEFPEIYKVKCINHSTYDFRSEGYDIPASEFVPGFVTVVVIPDLRNKNSVNILEPKASLDTLSKIEKFLKGSMSPFAARRLKVINPTYTAVKLFCAVKFIYGEDFGICRNRLNIDIKNCLSPWAFNSSRFDSIVFGGKIYKSRLINFIEELPYIDYIQDVKMVKDNDDVNDYTVIETDSPRTIFVSVKEHSIEKAN